MSAIFATGLRKSFGGHVVLDGIDLDVRATISRATPTPCARRSA